MTFVRRRAIVRRAVAAVASAGLLAAGALVGAGPAAAAGAPSPHGGATATLHGLEIYDQAVVRKDGESRKTGAGLFEMGVQGGGTLQSYCVDVDNPTQEQARYQEVPSSASSLHANKDAGKIRWILRHSYPQVNDLQSLAKSSGAKRLTPDTAAAGTQVAIWRYSDDAEVEALDPDAEKLADHLEKAARNVSEPRASLSLEPAEVSGKAGGRIGPVTVRTSEPSVAVAPAADAATSGVHLVGKDGKPVDTARNGTELYFDVPEDTDPGSTSLTVQTSAKVPVGRTFAGVGEHAKSQTQILAGSSSSTVSATATANWADGGAIPAATAQKNCAKGGVDVTVTNGGDEPFAFRLSGEKHEIPVGGKDTITVPVEEDQPYRIAISGPHGFEKTFSGVLDCATASAVSTQDEADMAPQTQPATVGGGEGATADGSADLAETGASSSTPWIIGIAIGLVVVGGVAVLAVRRRGPETAEGTPSTEGDASTGSAEKADGKE
ncbi:thioester domain-containing protein [Streptomyces daliensis]|uniref:Thioester domain-containing protein n=1 Tax=Streptomyces daliensis TaxID=299421 RepID=A0A8T4IJK8_9ACTN|nr:thioester domain-containing protein [Streptomyces daliensis]